MLAYDINSPAPTLLWCSEVYSSRMTVSFSGSGHSEVANVSAEKTYEPGSTWSFIDYFLAAKTFRFRHLTSMTSRV